MFVWVKNKIEDYLSSLEGMYFLKHLIAACHPNPLRYLMATGIVVALVYFFAYLLLFERITQAEWWLSGEGQFTRFFVYWLVIVSVPFLIAMVHGYRHRNNITDYIVTIPQYESAGMWRRLVIAIYAVIRFGGFVVICVYLAKKAIDFVQSMSVVFL